MANPASRRAPAETPSVDCFVTFARSSRKPRKAKEKVTNSVTQTYGFVRLPQSATPTIRPSQIKRPPIVGVPFFDICASSDRSRIGCPLPWRARSALMITSPKMTVTRNAVTTAAPVRKVM